MHKNSLVKLATLSTALALILPAQAAFAQDDTNARANSERGSDSGLNTITVTATRQSLDVQDVPLSVAAYSEEDLKNRGVNTIDGVIELTPGANISRATTSPLGATVTIRGIATGGGSNLAGTTGVYIDDTPIQVRNIGFSASTVFPVIFDLERVEILRGPQGTLFGAGAEGGAVRFITPKPNFRSFEGRARVELSTIRGGGNSYEGGVALGGPLIEDKLAFRASAYHRREGGYIDRVPQLSGNVAEENANWTESTVGRVALTWQPDDTLEITPSLSYQRQYANGTPAIYERESDFEDHEFISGSKSIEGFTDRFYIPALSISADLGETLELISNTSYFDRKSFGNNDYTFLQAASTSGSSYLTPETSYFQSTVEQGNAQKNWSEELRLQTADPDAMFNFVAGLFFSRAEQTALQRTIIPTFETYYQQVRNVTFLSRFGRGLLPGGVYLVSNVTSEDKQQAAFANVDFKPIDTVTLTAGVRVAHTSFSYSADYDGPGNGPTPYSDAGEQSEYPITPKFGISYQPNPDLLFYANVAKGYRQGGAQQRLPTNCQAELSSLGYDDPPTTFASDSVWSYELGAKGTLFGGNVQYDASVYRIDFKNIQRGISISSCARTITVNAGDAVSEGFDLALQTRPMEGLTLGGAIGYNAVNLTEDLFSGAVNGGAPRLLVGEEDSLNGREWSGFVNAQYEFFAFGDFDAFVWADYRYSGPQRPGTIQNAGASSYDPNIGTLDEYDSANARIGLRSSAVEVSVFATNLFDAHPLLSRTHYLTSNPLYTVTTLQPRTVGVTVTQRF